MKAELEERAASLKRNCHCERLTSNGVAEESTDNPTHYSTVAILARKAESVKNDEYISQSRFQGLIYPFPSLYVAIAIKKVGTSLRQARR